MPVFPGPLVPSRPPVAGLAHHFLARGRRRPQREKVAVGDVVAIQPGVLLSGLIHTRGAIACAVCAEAREQDLHEIVESGEHELGVLGFEVDLDDLPPSGIQRRLEFGQRDAKRHSAGVQPSHHRQHSGLSRATDPVVLPGPCSAEIVRNEVGRMQPDKAVVDVQI